MKIDKAIETLMAQRYSFPTDEMRVINNALGLGIEALKRVKRTRDKRFPVLGEELPGETKD